MHSATPHAAACAVSALHLSASACCWHACADAPAGQHALLALVAVWCMLRWWALASGYQASAKRLTQHHVAGRHVISHVVAVAGGQHGRVCKGDGAGQVAGGRPSCRAGLALQGGLQAAVPIPVRLLVDVLLLLLPPAFCCSDPPSLGRMLSPEGHRVSMAPRGHAGNVLRVAPGGAYIEEVAGLHPQALLLRPNLLPHTLCRCGQSQAPGSAGAGADHCQAPGWGRGAGARPAAPAEHRLQRRCCASVCACRAPGQGWPPPRLQRMYA